MKKFTLTLTCIFIVTCFSFSQVAINTDGTDPHISAMLDVESGHSKPENRPAVFHKGAIRYTAFESCQVCRSYQVMLRCGPNAGTVYGTPCCKWQEVWVESGAGFLFFYSVGRWSDRLVGGRSGWWGRILGMCEMLQMALADHLCDLATGASPPNQAEVWCSVGF